MNQPTMQEAVNAVAAKERRQNAAEIAATLDRISRDRALTEAESRRLAAAMSQSERLSDRRRYYWSEDMDRRMLDMRRKRVRFPVIAETLGVSLKAAEMRIWRLRKMGVANGC